ncbi:MAG: hypothetical protein HRT72_10930 [Flavobacteriales bacterium]|nr:hypothetical protein [Flavobacteriales bacterium]
MRLNVFALILFIVIGFSSCKKDTIISDKAIDYLVFSVDTVLFDTVFTTRGTVTKNFKIYNTSNQSISISNIRLSNGENSNYNINVDGIASSNISDLQIAENDSMYVFVEATIDPNGINQPLIVSDSIIFESGTQQTYVALVAYGQDAIYHLPNYSLPGHSKIHRFENCNSVLTNEKPHVFYGHAYVDSLCQLTIEEGAVLHFSSASLLWVSKNASLNINGTLSNPVKLGGTRLDYSFQNIPGQWEGILIEENNTGIHIDYAIIKNANNGINVKSASLEINNTKIQNMLNAGLTGTNSSYLATNLLITNCGESLLKLIGGNHDFNHCTFANFWQTDIRTSSAVQLSNQTVNNNFESIYLPLSNISFGNCIISGSLDEELAFNISNSELFEVSFKNCIINREDVSNTSYFENTISTPDDLTIEGILHHPIFTDYLNGDFSPFKQSIVNNAGDVTIGNLVPLDINGNSRTSDSAPDIGAMEFNF